MRPGNRYAEDHCRTNRTPAGKVESNCHGLLRCGRIVIGMPETEMSEKPLTRQQAIERLVAFEPDIRALGVQRLALFGSVARGPSPSR